MAKKESTIADLLATTINMLNTKYGKGSVMTFDSTPQFDGQVIPSSSLGVNEILGVGGLPRGRIIEFYAEESAGKTSLSLDFAANCQKMGGKVVFVDVEHALSTRWAQILGVDLAKDFWIAQPSYGEEAIDIVEQFAKTGEVDLIILDSVAALSPKAELDREVEDVTVGSQARLMSRTMRRLTAIASKSNCTIIFINQLRSKINTFGFGGDGKVTSGGNALKYFASIRLELKKVGQRKIGDQKVGDNIRITCTKNKVAAPYKACEIPMIVDEGFSTATELIDILLLKGLARKGGAWYTLLDTEDKEYQKFQGEQNFKQWFLDNPEEKDKYLALSKVTDLI